METPTAAEALAVHRFLTTALETQSRIIVELLKVTNGEIPSHTRKAIHELLRPMSEAAIGVPERLSALRVFDQMVALFPPPDREDDR